MPLPNLPRTRRCSLPLLLSAALTSGCAGLESQALGPSASAEGLAYYLPMRYFQLEVTVADRKVTEMKWSTSDAFADTRHAFLLRYNAHLIGKTTVHVAVNAKGLLGQASTATTDANVALAAVAPVAPAAVPSIKADGDPAEALRNECPGSNKFLLVLTEPGESTRLCGQKIKIVIAAANGAGNGHSGERDTSNPTPGIYYRINLPYIATAQVEDSNDKAPQRSTALLFVPNASPTMLLPFGRTAFAANNGGVQLTDGVLSVYDQANDGELAALLKFPASVMGAYFTAVGNVFSAFSSRDTRDLAVRQAELKNDLLRLKLDRCSDALNKNDSAALQALQCGTN